MDGILLQLFDIFVPLNREPSNVRRFIIYAVLYSIALFGYRSGFFVVPDGHEIFAEASVFVLCSAPMTANGRLLPIALHHELAAIGSRSVSR